MLLQTGCSKKAKFCYIEISEKPVCHSNINIMTVYLGTTLNFSQISLSDVCFDVHPNTENAKCLSMALKESFPGILIMVHKIM